MGHNGEYVTSVLVKFLKKLRQYHYNEYLEKVCKQVDVKNIPLQENNDDCGLYILKYAQYLMNNSDFKFTCKEIPYFRKRLLYELYLQKLFFP